MSPKFCWQLLHEHTESPKIRRAKQFPASQTQSLSTFCLIRREEVLSLAQAFSAALNYPLYILNTSQLLGPPLHALGLGFPSPNSKKAIQGITAACCNFRDRDGDFLLPNKTSLPSPAQLSLDVDLSHSLMIIIPSSSQWEDSSLVLQGYLLPRLPFDPV